MTASPRELRVEGREGVSPANQHAPLPPARVGVVIVNYETSNMVRRCLASLELQTVSRDVVVVDNPSAVKDADNLRGIDADFTLLHMPENVGYGRAINAAVELLGPCEFVCVLNPDTALAAGALDAWVDAWSAAESAAQAANASPPGCIAPVLLNDNGTPQLSAYHFVGPLNYWRYHSIFGGALKTLLKRMPARESFQPSSTNTSAQPSAARQCDWLMGAAMLVPMHAWRAVGGFDPAYFLYAEDADLCHRLAAAGFSTWQHTDLHITHTQGEPDAAARGRGAYRLFAGLRLFMQRRYSPARRIAVTICVIADMLLRITLFTPIAVVRGPRSLATSRLRGAWAILRLYVTGRTTQF